MFKSPKILIVALLACVALLGIKAWNYHEENKIGNQIMAEIEHYPWFEEVVTYEGTFWPNYVSYSTRASLARTLEEAGLYWAATTPYCSDQTDDFHDQQRDTCYIGTVEQNFALLSALQNPETQEFLRYKTPFQIVNGVNGNYLEWMESLAVKYCPDEIEETGECIWQEHVDAMRALTS